MDEQRIQKQIAIYMTDKKLCEFNDKLKLAPVDYYAHVHAQGEKQEDGSRQRSCIGMVLQDYSNGTGDKTVRVMANLSPEFFAYALSRVSIGVENFDFNEEKIFGEPDSNGLSVVTKTTIKRASYGKNGEPRNYPWFIMVENGRAVKEKTQKGGVHMLENCLPWIGSVPYAMRRRNNTPIFRTTIHTGQNSRRCWITLMMVMI